jgi:hypothetical protein
MDTYHLNYISEFWQRIYFTEWSYFIILLVLKSSYGKYSNAPG